MLENTVYSSMKIHWFFKVMLVLITAFFIWVIFYFGTPKIVPPQRIESQEVYGLIFADQVWGGEIKIVGDIFSPTNNTITVLPGTKILVAIKGDKSNMDFLPWHRKSGVNSGLEYRGVRPGEAFWDESEKIQIHLNNLVILGEPSNPVIVTSDSEVASPYDFNVLKIKSGTITNAFFSNYRRFEAGEGTEIMNSNFKNTGECSLCLTGGKSFVTNNTFENSLRESIWIDRASPNISNNLFVNLAGEGIRANPRKIGSPKITHNTFEMPEQTALNITSSNLLDEILVENNFFSGNSQIKIACDSRVKIRDNIILGSVSFSNGCSGSYIFNPNFWGTPDTKTIMSEKILNKDPKFTITIPNVLLSPPKDAGKR